jgi:hypothetical protein
MTSISPERTAIAIAALKYYPPLIRNSLLNDVSFTGEYGLKANVTITLGSNGPSLIRSSFFDAIRSVLSGDVSVSLTDEKDKIWMLTRDESGAGSAALILSCDQQRLILPNFSELSGDVSSRIRALEDSAADVNLPVAALQKWRNLLEMQPLSDFEFDQLTKDVSDSPVNLGSLWNTRTTRGTMAL